jgi:UDP-perosamine 4-acetyltransferase
MKKIILVGAGGHGKVVLDALLKLGSYEVQGFVDNDTKRKEVLGVKIIGNDQDLENLFKSGCAHAFVSVGSVGDPKIRMKLAAKLKSIGFTLPAIVHPAAVVARGVKIDEGAFIAAGAVIGPDSKIGRNAIINTNASVDHDCNIGDFVHIAPGVTLSGGVEVGEGAHLGSGASVIEYKKIGVGTVVGAGSVVISDLPAESKAYGVPCRVAGEQRG